MKVDPYKTGASIALNKPFDDVTSKERSLFKRALFEVLYSDVFMSYQKDYVQEAMKRQLKEFDEEEALLNTENQGQALNTAELSYVYAVACSLLRKSDFKPAHVGQLSSKYAKAVEYLIVNIEKFKKQDENTLFKNLTTADRSNPTFKDIATAAFLHACSRERSRNG